MANEEKPPYFSPVALNPKVVECLTRGSMTDEEYRGLYANSYDRVAILPLISNKEMIKHVEYCIKNSSGGSHAVPEHYNDAVIHWLAPELIRRLRKAEETIDRLNQQLDGT